MADFILTADVKLANRTTAETQIRDIERRLSGSGSLALGKLTGQASEFEKSLAAANARVLAFGASAGIIAGVSMAIRGMVSETIKVEKTLTDINVLLGKSTKGIEQFGNSLFSIAKSTGQSFFDVAEAAKEFSRQGLSAEETLRRTNDAMVLTRLTGLDLEKSVTGLTATVNGFAKEMLTTTEIVNRMANVDAQFAVSSKDMVEALSRSSQVAEDAGVSFNEFIAVVTALQQKTARGGAVIGNSLKTIFTRLQRPETLDDLEKFGIAVRDAGGATLPMMDLLRNLVGVYGDLSAAQKTSVSSLAGGVYQINIVKALFSDLGKTVPEYAKALNVANRSTDEAIQRNAALNKSMSATANEAGQNILKMAAGGGKLVFGPSIKKVLGGVNELGEAMDGEGWGQKLGAGLLKGIGNALAGPGLILATVLGAKLFGAFLKYSVGALATISGIGEASGRILNMQHGIVEMSQQDARIKEILGNTLTSHIQKQTAILAIMREQVTAQQLLNSSARSVATGLTMRGVTYSPQSNVRIKGLAGGYIPASQIPAQHVMNEVAQASAAGYSISPANVRAMRTTINGAATTVVYNDKEKIVDNFMGSGEPAIIPPTGRFMNFGGGSKFAPYPNTALRVNLNGITPTHSKTGLDAGLRKVDDFLRNLVGVKGGDLPRILLSRDKKFFDEEGAHGIMNFEDNLLSVSIPHAFQDLPRGVSPEHRQHIAHQKMASVLVHEGFHAGFDRADPGMKKALLAMVGGGKFDERTTLKQASKLLANRFGTTPKHQRDIRKAFEKDYRHLEYPAEELAAMKFPAMWGFPAAHAAGGILARKKLLGALPYSKGGARLGTVEFKEKSDALILDMVTTKMGPDGNRLQGTGILNFAFEQLLRRAKKGGYARVGFTPINGKVIGKAQKLFGKKDSLGNPIDFGNDVFLDTNKFGHLFESVKNAAFGFGNVYDMQRPELLAMAQRLGIGGADLTKANTERLKKIVLNSEQYKRHIRQSYAAQQQPSVIPGLGSDRPFASENTRVAGFSHLTSAGPSDLPRILGAPPIAPASASVLQAQLLKMDTERPSYSYTDPANSLKAGSQRDWSQREHAQHLVEHQEKLNALNEKKILEGRGIGPQTLAQSESPLNRRLLATPSKEIRDMYRPFFGPDETMNKMLTSQDVKPQGKPLGKRLNELRTMAFDWGAVDEAAEDKKYGKIAALSPNATPEQKADHDRATQARNQRLQTKQQAHGQTSQRLMLASFATPMIGGLVTSGIDQSTLQGQQKARTAQGVTSAIGTGIMLGTAVGGPMGAAVGGVVGSVMAIKAAFDGLTPSIEELSEQAKKEAEGRNTKFEALKGVVDIDNAITSGDATPSQLREYYRQRSEKVKAMSPEDRTAVEEAGGDVSKLQDVLSNRANANTRADFASRVKTAVKDASEKGFKGQNVQDIVELMAATADTSNLSREDIEEKLKQLQETGSAGLIKGSVRSDALRGVALGDRGEAKAALISSLSAAEVKAMKNRLRDIQTEEELETRRLGVVRRAFSLFMASSEAQSKMFKEGSRQERVGRYVNAAVEYDGRNVEARGNLRNIYAQGFGDYYSESAKRDIESASRVEQMEQGFNGGEMQRKLSALGEIRQVASGGITSALEGLREASKGAIDSSRQEKLNNLSEGVLQGFGGMGLETVGKNNFGMPQGEMEQLLAVAQQSQTDLAEGGDSDKAQKFTTAITALERSFEEATKVTQKYQDEVAIANAQQIQLGRNLSRELIAQSSVSQFKNVMSGYRFSEGLNSGPQKQSSLLEVEKTSAEIDQFGRTNKNKFTSYGSEGNRQLIAQAQGLVIKKAKAIEGAIAEGSIKTKSQMIAEMSLSGGPVSNEQTFLDNYRAQAEIHNEEAKSFDDFKPRSLVPSGAEMADFRKQQGKEFGATYQGQAWTKQKDALAAGFLVSNYQNNVANISERGSSVADIFGDSKNWGEGQNWTKDAGELRALARNGQVAQLGIKAQSLLKSGRISETQSNALQGLTGSIQTFEASQSNGRAKSYADAQAVAKMGGEDVTKDLLSNTTFTNGLQALELSAASTSNNTKEMATILGNISSSIKNLERAPITNVTVTTTSAKELEEIMQKYQALAKDVAVLKKELPPSNNPPEAPNNPVPMPIPLGV